VSNDTNGFPDIFERDLSTGNMFPVSVDSASAFATNQGALEPVISADGRYVAFGKRAPCNPFTCGKEDLFRRDLQNRATALVSIRADVTAAGISSSSAPSISSDGHLVAFQSLATDLVIGPYFSVTNVFLRDMILATNKLVSINRFGTAAGNGVSFAPLFSPDDRWIIFASRARTREGQLQVELAQLKYLLPRLIAGQDSAFSRLAGGIGGRGPGETKLEIGRRRACAGTPFPLSLRRSAVSLCIYELRQLYARLFSRDFPT
jgi:Tol biopolymer transport system component